MISQGTHFVQRTSLPFFFQVLCRRTFELQFELIFELFFPLILGINTVQAESTVELQSFQRLRQIAVAAASRQSVRRESERSLEWTERIDRVTKKLSEQLIAKEQREVEKMIHMKDEKHIHQI